ncbi:ABC transporter G family member 15 [Dendrobium catenatum]|uniref:ABC transporter G family member 15 n=1 Tax=Dendrobium catenatum TaxID=906689 RepID=A0A2I0W9V5_9ASPA|nr:ABC transporter G family member 15 [Dendrobium catenatum]
MGIITGAGIQGVMILNGGFFRLPNDLPKPLWRYPMYYIAFHKYANQGFYKNEFIGLTFPKNQAGGPSTINGEEILRDTWQVEVGYSNFQIFKCINRRQGQKLMARGNGTKSN